MEYNIVEVQNNVNFEYEAKEKFIKSINEEIENGWEPVGGVSITLRTSFLGTKHNICYSQAMILKV